ncbi:phosphotransferase enzyme family protein [Dyella ginsengisoli]|uniref:phosphotransferase enzyme family protein n=1 Tax=Dyella ginsengisoli TaxID=363848 RepID=UPI000347E7CC|nr:phosphotransferase [Dyella ginsengisoli]
MTDSTHRVHGLAGDEIAPDWPALTEAELSSVLATMPAAGGLRRVLWRSPRPLSAAGLVETARGSTVFVKRHHVSVRAAATLAEEHALLEHLHRHGLPVVEVLADCDGQTALAHGDWTYEVHTVARGEDLYRDTISWQPPDRLAHARTAGRMLARLHAASASYSAAQRGTHILVARSELATAADPVATLRSQLPQRPALAAYLARRDWPRDLERLFAPWRAAQPALVRQPRLWTHGDWHVSNLCWSGGGDTAEVTCVLDFGLAACNFALFDLATAIERNAIAWLALDAGDAAARPDIARALIAGYREERPLGTDELHLLADLLPVVHVDFALSEVEYFHGITRSAHAADVAYDTFLIGHAAWFEDAPGQRLLAAIRDAG